MTPPLRFRAWVPSLPARHEQLVWAAQQADPSPGSIAAQRTEHPATRRSSLGLCVAGENMSWHLGDRHKDAMSHVRWIFMTDHTESLVTFSNEQNTKLDGSRWGRKGRGDPLGNSVSWSHHLLLS